tara:strand:+ start:9797 stop:10255 length:459 start_codon:yes stop_codon:yes gene_type:complete
MCDEVECYNIYPEHKDCIYTTEHWSNSLSSGKDVTVLYVQQWRDGTFTIELDEKGKQELLTKEDIILNDIGACTEEITSGWFYEAKIKDEEKYSDEEIKEIHKLMFCDKDNEDEYDCEGDYDFEQDIMETNDWSMDDTIYEITNGFELEQTS